jgi:hypothetical protein
MDESQIKEEIERASATQLPPEDIAKWMRHDTWTRTDAMLILMGIDPDRTAIIERKTEYGKPEWAFDQDGPWLMGQDDCAPTRSEIRRFEESLTERMRAWDSGGHPSGCSPEYFIKWSVDHGFSVRWLEAARDVGLIREPSDAEVKAVPANAQSVDINTKDTMSRNDPVKYRAYLLDLKSTGMTSSQIATIEGISPGRVRQLWVAAREDQQVTAATALSLSGMLGVNHS